MKSMRKLIFLAVVAVALAGCGGNNGDSGNSSPPAGNGQATAPSTEPAADPSIEATARPVYESNCMACHGTDLAGVGNFPSLQQVGARLSREQILERIQNGGNGMPAFQGVLADEDIQALAQWLSEAK